MPDWKKFLRCNPVPALLASGSPAIEYFTRRDLLGEKVERIETFRELQCAERILRKQQSDGAWNYHGGREYLRAQVHYNQVETYRMLGELIEKYGLNMSHPQIGKAAEFLFRCQTAGGDFRGIYANQYTPNYTAGIMELLINQGFVSEISLLVHPVIVGNRGYTIFGGIDRSVNLKLHKKESLEKGCMWLVYKVEH